MAGDIPETGDLYDMFKNPDDDSMEADAPIDDATTNYTKDEIPKHQPLVSLSKEPIIGFTTPSKPKVVEADDDYIPDKNEPDLDQIPEDPPAELDEDFSILPNIYATSDAPSRNNAYGRRTQSPGKKNNPESLFIYKDFDTSLTKVKGPVNRLPKL